MTTSLPIADWQAALSEMETVLDGAFVVLDRYESQWASLLQGPRVDRTSPLDSVSAFASLEARLRDWDTRLTAAAELASGVERQLGEGEAAVGRWQAVFSVWRGLLEKGAGSKEPVT